MSPRSATVRACILVIIALLAGACASNGPPKASYPRGMNSSQEDMRQIMRQTTPSGMQCGHYDPNRIVGLLN